MVAYVLHSTSPPPLTSFVSYRMQACYVNATHPDFLGGHKVRYIIT